MLKKFCLAMVALSFSLTSHSALLQMNFTGSVGSVFNSVGGINAGDSISGYWLVDTASVDSNAASDVGEYAQSGAPSFLINIGANTFESNSSVVQILNDYTAGFGQIDAYDVLAGSGATTSISGIDMSAMQITLRDTQAPLNVFGDDSLPNFAPDPNAFDQVGQSQGQIAAWIDPNTLFFVDLEIDSVSLVPVPLPAAAWLFGSAILGLGLMRRKAS